MSTTDSESSSVDATEKEKVIRAFINASSELISVSSEFEKAKTRHKDALHEGIYLDRLEGNAMFTKHHALRVWDGVAHGDVSGLMKSSADALQAIENAENASNATRKASETIRATGQYREQMAIKERHAMNTYKVAKEALAALGVPEPPNTGTGC